MRLRLNDPPVLQRVFSCDSLVGLRLEHQFADQLSGGPRHTLSLNVAQDGGLRFGPGEDASFYLRVELLLARVLEWIVTSQQRVSHDASRPDI